MVIEEFQDGGHLGYKNRTLLPILRLHVAQLPSNKFWFNPTYGSGEEMLFLKNFKMVAMAATLDIGKEPV